MSYSKSESGLKNPATKFLEWKGQSFRYYDKEAKENVVINDKLFIVVLDELSAIKGWHDESQSGIYSNEVHRTAEEEMVVRSFKGGELVRGLYKEIKGNLEGGRYCKSIYAALINATGEVTELVNIGLMGAALKPWIDLEGRAKGSVITLAPSDKKLKKGSVTYYAPEISVAPKRDSMDADLKAMDETLQEYLGQYAAKNMADAPKKEAPVNAAPVVEQKLEEAGDDLPF